MPAIAGRRSIAASAAAMSPADRKPFCPAEKFHSTTGTAAAKTIASRRGSTSRIAARNPARLATIQATSAGT